MVVRSERPAGDDEMGTEEPQKTERATDVEKRTDEEDETNGKCNELKADYRLKVKSKHCAKSGL